MNDRDMLTAVTKALGDLSFECFRPIGTPTAPSIATYNRTFGVLEDARKHLAAQKPVADEVRLANQVLYEGVTLSGEPGSMDEKWARATLARAAQEPTPCGNCGGEKRVRDYARDGEDAEWKTCWACEGTGTQDPDGVAAVCSDEPRKGSNDGNN